LYPFVVESNQSRVINRSFQTGPSGLNRAIIHFGVWNIADKKKFIGNFSTDVSYDVSPSSDRMQNNSVFIATGY
jgi:hypothetical protein